MRKRKKGLRKIKIENKNRHDALQNTISSFLPTNCAYTTLCLHIIFLLLHSFIRYAHYKQHFQCNIQTFIWQNKIREKNTANPSIVCKLGSCLKNYATIYYSYAFQPLCFSCIFSVIYTMYADVCLCVAFHYSITQKQRPTTHI